MLCTDSPYLSIVIHTTQVRFLLRVNHLWRFSTTNVSYNDTTIILICNSWPRPYNKIEFLCFLTGKSADHKPFSVALAGQLDFGWDHSFTYTVCIAEWLLGAVIIFLPWSSSPPAISWVMTQCCSEAVPAQSHLSRKVSPAGTQSAVCGVRAGTAEQQRLLLKAALSTPRAVGRKQVVHILAGAGAAYPKSKKKDQKWVDFSSMKHKWQPKACVWIFQYAHRPVIAHLHCEH